MTDSGERFSTRPLDFAEERRELVAELAEALAGGDSLILRAPRGHGKTTVARSVKTQLDEFGHTAVLFSLDAGSTAGETGGVQFLERLLAAFGIATAVLDPLDALLSAADAGQRRVIVIDDAERIGAFAPHVKASLRELVTSSRYSMLLCVSDMTSLVEEGRSMTSSLMAEFSVADLPPLSFEQSVRFLEERLPSAERDLTVAVAEATAGVPRLLNIVGEYLQQLLRNADELDRAQCDLQALVATAYELSGRSLNESLPAVEQEVQRLAQELQRRGVLRVSAVDATSRQVLAFLRVRLRAKAVTAGGGVNGDAWTIDRLLRELVGDENYDSAWHEAGAGLPNDYVGATAEMSQAEWVFLDRAYGRLMACVAKQGQRVIFIEPGRIPRWLTPLRPMGWQTWQELAELVVLAGEQASGSVLRIVLVTDQEDVGDILSGYLVRQRSLPIATVPVYGNVADAANTLCDVAIDRVFGLDRARASLFRESSPPRAEADSVLRAVRAAIGPQGAVAADNPFLWAIGLWRQRVHGAAHPIASERELSGLCLEWLKVAREIDDAEGLGRWAASEGVGRHPTVMEVAAFLLAVETRTPGEYRREWLGREVASGRGRGRTIEPSGVDGDDLPEVHRRSDDVMSRVGSLMEALLGAGLESFLDAKAPETHGVPENRLSEWLVTVRWREDIAAALGDELGRRALRLHAERDAIELTGREDAADLAAMLLERRGCPARGQVRGVRSHIRRLLEEVSELEQRHDGGRSIRSAAADVFQLCETACMEVVIAHGYCLEPYRARVIDKLRKWGAVPADAWDHEILKLDLGRLAALVRSLTKRVQRGGDWDGVFKQLRHVGPFDGQRIHDRLDEIREVRRDWVHGGVAPVTPLTDFAAAHKTLFEPFRELCEDAGFLELLPPVVAVVATRHDAWGSHLEVFEEAREERPITVYKVELESPEFSAMKQYYMISPTNPVPVDPRLIPRVELRQRRFRKDR